MNDSFKSMTIESRQYAFCEFISNKEDEQILQAEIFIENLPGKEKALIENYIDSLINQLALEEAFLYQHGYIDGIKILKYINSL